MKAYLKLIRWPNVLMIGTIQYVWRYCLVLQEIPKSDLLFNEFQFGLLVLSSMLIAGGGYAINDYFDIKTDRYNKGGDIIVSKLIKRTHVLRFHIYSSIAACIICLFVGWQLSLLFWALLGPLSIALLYMYSSYFKRTFLFGNLLVSSLIAVLVFALVYLEMLYSSGEGIAMSLLVTFAGFAFISNLIREIIKDVEDRKGDKLTGCTTVPIVLGVNKTKQIIVGLILICQAAILTATFHFRGDTLSFLYAFALLIAPLSWCIYLVKFAQSKKTFHSASSWLKLIMLVGMFTILLV